MIATRDSRISTRVRSGSTGKPSTIQAAKWLQHTKLQAKDVVHPGRSVCILVSAIYMSRSSATAFLYIPIMSPSSRAHYSAFRYVPCDATVHDPCTWYRTWVLPPTTRAARVHGTRRRLFYQYPLQVSRVMASASCESSRSWNADTWAAATGRRWEYAVLYSGWTLECPPSAKGDLLTKRCVEGVRSSLSGKF